MREKRSRKDSNTKKDVQNKFEFDHISFSIQKKWKIKKKGKNILIGKYKENFNINKTFQTTLKFVHTLIFSTQKKWKKKKFF